MSGTTVRKFGPAQGAREPLAEPVKAASQQQQEHTMKRVHVKQTRAGATAASSAAGKRKLAGSAPHAQPAGDRAPDIVVLPLGRAEAGSSSTAAGVWLRAVPRASSSG